MQNLQCSLLRLPLFKVLCEVSPLIYNFSLFKLIHPLFINLRNGDRRENSIGGNKGADHSQSQLTWTLC